MIGNGEYISREAAVELLSQPITMSMCLTLEECKHKNAQRQIDLFVIRGLPAADVRPVRRGFWVEVNGEDAHTGELWCIWKCSECGARRTAGWKHTQEGRKPRDNFCPNCGADMKEES